MHLTLTVLHPQCSPEIPQLVFESAAQCPISLGLYSTDTTFLMGANTPHAAFSDYFLFPIHASAYQIFVFLLFLNREQRNQTLIHFCHLYNRVILQFGNPGDTANI